jgi:hypothetical protein
MLTCGECDNVCGEGHSFCFKCGRNVMASQKIQPENFDIEAVTDLLRQLGWDAEIHGTAIVITIQGFYRWHCSVVSRDSLLLAQTSWGLKKGIPASQILECVNAMNINAWQTSSFLYEREDGERMLCVNSVAPISSTFNVYAIDRLARMAEAETSLLISTSGTAQLCS